jgi:hypothetical protein
MSTDAIDLRCDLIDGQFDLPPATLEYMALVRRELAAVAARLRDARPDAYDYGRFVAFLDKLQEAKDTACVSVILGAEQKKRKTADAK